MNNSAIWCRAFGEPEKVLSLESAPKLPLPAHHIRVKMLCAPVNASDLIPVTGAYRHRTSLPLIAGYEGVGIVTEAPAAHTHLLGQRVLPLRGEGTWQHYVDCSPDEAIAVPEDIDHSLAARAYINPLAASLMLKRFAPAGKKVLITAAGSDCGILLAQWARNAGATHVTGIYRSAVHRIRLEACGATPAQQDNLALLTRYAAEAEVVYDATGGRMAALILSQMPASGVFVSYGLLSGQPFRTTQPLPKVHWFHIRNALQAMSAAAWQSEFAALWPRLRSRQTSGTMLFPLSDWQEAIRIYRTAGRITKPLLAMA